MGSTVVSGAIAYTHHWLDRASFRVVAARAARGKNQCRVTSHRPGDVKIENTPNDDVKVDGEKRKRKRNNSGKIAGASVAGTQSHKTHRTSLNSRKQDIYAALDSVQVPTVADKRETVQNCVNVNSSDVPSNLLLKNCIAQHLPVLPMLSEKLDKMLRGMTTNLEQIVSTKTPSSGSAWAKTSARVCAEPTASACILTWRSRSSALSVFCRGNRRTRRSAACVFRARGPPRKCSSTTLCTRECMSMVSSSAFTTNTRNWANIGSRPCSSALLAGRYKICPCPSSGTSATRTKCLKTGTFFT